MARRSPILLACALLFCATAAADDSADANYADVTKADVKEKVKKVEAAKAVAVVKVKVVVKKATAAQQAAAKKLAAKKLAEAQKVAKQAADVLAEAEKEAAATEGEKAKQDAAKRVEEAKSKLEEARKAVAKLQAELKKAAAAQVFLARAGFARGSSVAVREKVDPQDAVERFVLLTPGGPLVIEAAMTIDGKPFRQAREKLVDELLVAADTDKDGKATWTEALKTSRFTLGRVRITNDQQRQQYIKNLDKNGNGLVERLEARTFIAQYFQGPAFTLSGGYGYRGSFGGGIVIVNGVRTYAGRGRADVQTLLDTDKDGVLSEKEIAAAGKRLKSRDADDNDLLYPQELSGGAGAAANLRFRTMARQAPQQLAMLLGETAKAEPLFKALQARYKNDDGDIVAGRFPAFPKLFGKLDKNDDGKLAQDEVLALNRVEPHVRLSIDLGKGGAGKGLALKKLAPELSKIAASGKAISIEFPGVKLSLTANLNKARTYNYSATAKSLLTRYDKDGNGYLDKKELAGNLARQLELWDSDGDGKVYAKEITASYARMQAPQSSQIRATASSGGNSLFQTLDVSGDGRLSLREMRTAHERIMTFDKNKDKRIARDEIPVALSISVGLGNAGYAYYRSTQGRPGGNRPAAPNDAPDWFTRMDRNGDGDVTLKEFLGDKEAFQKLDTNSDGFIEPKEAKAADKANSK